MNSIIAQYFDDLEARFIASPVIGSYQSLRQKITPEDGKVRINAKLTDGGTVELFEYVRESQENIITFKYSFHWQDARSKLVKRWDNAPHYPGLKNSPHHLHLADESVTDGDPRINIYRVIEEIEKTILE